jgi:hypothetical protein
MSALGSLALQRGNTAVGETMYRKALQACQAVQGMNHPETSACLLQLVALLRGANKAANALPLAQRCLLIKRQVGARGAGCSSSVLVWQLLFIQALASPPTTSQHPLRS